MKTNKILFFIIAAVVFASCSSLKITHNMDTSLDFSKYKTYSYYGWDSTSTNIGKYYQREIEFAFVDEFTERGLKYDPTGQGDIVVSLFLMIDVEKGVRSYNNYYGHSGYGFHQPRWGYGYGYGYGYGSPYMYGGVAYEEYNYVTGTLVCDIFDRGTKKLAWQGIASKSIETSKKGRNIKKIISRLMLKFPVDKIETK